MKAYNNHEEIGSNKYIKAHIKFIKYKYINESKYRNSQFEKKNDERS